MKITKAPSNQLEITKYLSGGDLKYLLEKDDEAKIFQMKEKIDKQAQELKKTMLEMLLINALAPTTPAFSSQNQTEQEEALNPILNKPTFFNANSNASPFKQLEKVSEDLEFVYDAYIVDVLYKTNIGLLIAVSKSLRSKQGNEHASMLECVQAGYEGLMEGIKRFDYKKVNAKTKGVYKFSTNATWWIKQRIQAYLAENNNLIATPQYIKANKNRKNKTAEILEFAKEDSIKSKKQIAKRIQERQIEKMSNYSSLDKLELTKELQYKLPKEEQTPETNYDDGILRTAFNNVFEQQLTDEEIVALCYMRGYKYKDINKHEQELHAKQISKITGMSVQKINGLLWSAKKRIQSNPGAFGEILDAGRTSGKLGSLDKWFYNPELAKILPLNKGDKDLVLKLNEDGSIKELRCLYSITDPYNISKYIIKTKEYKRAMKSYKKQLKYVVIKDENVIIVETLTESELDVWYKKYVQGLREQARNWN